jgi:hypothetical protein
VWFFAWRRRRLGQCTKVKTTNKLAANGRATITIIAIGQHEIARNGKYGGAAHGGRDNCPS